MIDSAVRKHDETPWFRHPERDEYSALFQHHRDMEDVVEWKVKTRRAPALAVVRAFPARAQNHNIELRRLADEWKAATMFTSSIQEQILHPAYQQIIGFGERALPFLFDELRASDDYWFWALAMITRADPVRPEDQGNYVAMKEAWLTWAADHHL